MSHAARMTEQQWNEYRRRTHRGKLAEPAIPAHTEPAKSDRWPLVLRDQIVAAGLPEPLREACFHSTRGWRSDLSWPSLKVAVEIEGGAHSVKRQHGKDIEKHNAYVLGGWRYLRATPRMVETGEALAIVRELVRE